MSCLYLGVGGFSPASPFQLWPFVWGGKSPSDAPYLHCRQSRESRTKVLKPPASSSLQSLCLCPGTGEGGAQTRALPLAE